MQHGYFHLNREAAGRGLQSKISFFLSRVHLLTIEAVQNMFVSDKSNARFLMNERNQLTAERCGGQSTSLERWRPFGPHPMACWVGDPLSETRTKVKDGLFKKPGEL